MSFLEIEQIKACRSLQELEHLWKSNINAWSELPTDRARELIAAKDTQKTKLQLESEVDAAVVELNKLWEGYTMEDIAKERRQKATELDEKMTHYANVGDVQGFREALRKWKACWVPEEETPEHVEI